MSIQPLSLKFGQNPGRPERSTHVAERAPEPADL